MVALGQHLHATENCMQTQIIFLRVPLLNLSKEYGKTAQWFSITHSKLKRRSTAFARLSA